MTKFKTLIFVPEGSLLDEKAAERTALSQTLKSLGKEFGPVERLKFTNLQGQIKLLSQNERIELILQKFCGDNFETASQIFLEKMRGQKQLVKDAIPFLDKVKEKIKLILLSKEEKAIVSARLNETELLNYFSAAYFNNDFEEKLPDKKVLLKITQEQDLDTATCLVIGTNLSEEIQAAENANMQSLWLAPKKVKMPISPRPTLHLNKLSDLLFYLELS